ncbi:DUF1611 domain-containing protein [bacterium]|nr:MAG: DUF1611 domain-containing protein [bacterium]
MKVPNFPGRRDVAADLLVRARGSASCSIAVVGPGKDVGKTVTALALVRAARRAGYATAMTSMGRDGEHQDVATTLAKPRIVLPAGTLIATATALLPRSPAVEIVELCEHLTALGPVAIARVRTECAVELAGPSTGAAMRDVIERLKHDAQVVVMDGAVDRMAATAGGDDALVVATGAALAPTLAGVLEQTRALVARLTIPQGVPAGAIVVGGALTSARACELLARDDLERGVVVRDPHSLQLPAALLTAIQRRGPVSCRRPLNVVAATVSAQGPRHALDPVALARAVADSTGLPVYDIYRNAVVGG